MLLGEEEFGADSVTATPWQSRKNILSNYTHARQRLWRALYILVADGSLGDRLGSAHAELCSLRPHDFPGDLRDEYQNLMADLEKRIKSGPSQSARIHARRPVSTQMAQTVLGLYIKLRGGI